MKKVILSLIFILAFALTGCASVKEEKQSDTNAVAEYIASLLLKYDRYYDNKLVGMDVAASEQGMTDQTTNTGESSTDGTTVPTDGTTTDDGEITSDNEPQIALSDVIGNANFLVDYVSYKMYSEYPDSKSGAYFKLTAGKDRTLMVVLFNLANKTSKPQKISLIEAGITYNLSVNGETYKPLFTLLVSDLQFIDVTVKANESTKGYLVFEIPKDTKIGNASIEVAHEEKKTNISIE